MIQAESVFLSIAKALLRLLKSLPLLPAVMKKSTTMRSATRELAEKIADIHHGKVTTVKVEMIGKEDVSRLLRKVKAARKLSPSATFRVK